MNFLKYTERFAKNVIGQAMPDIAAKAFLELWQTWDVNFDKASQMVQDDISLVSIIKGNDLIRLKRAVKVSGEPAWFTPEWVVKTISGNSPSVASFFRFDPVAYSWLERQIEEIKNLST